MDCTGPATQYLGQSGSYARNFASSATMGSSSVPPKGSSRKRGGRQGA